MNSTWSGVWHLQTADCRPQTADRRPQTSDRKLQTIEDFWLERFPTKALYISCKKKNGKFEAAKTGSGDELLRKYAYDKEP